MARRPKVVRDTGFVDAPFPPGYMAIEVDEEGRRAGPINALGCMYYVLGLPLMILALVVPLMLLFMVLQQLPIIGPILGVPQ